MHSLRARSFFNHRSYLVCNATNRCGYGSQSTKLRKWTRQLTAHKQATARAGNSDALPPLTFAHEDDTVAVSATYMKGIIGDNRGLEQRYAIERAHVEKVKGEVRMCSKYKTRPLLCVL